MKKIVTLDDALKVLPGLTRQRSINADLLRIILDRRAGQCTWCGSPVGKGRQTWCSEDCVGLFRSRCCTSTQVVLVMERDNGVCSFCGRNTILSEKQFHAAWAIEKHNHGTFHSEYGRAMASMMASFGYGRGQWREVDHIVPVSEGGGLCDISNLRLLCGACHAEETRKLSQRAAKRNKVAKQ